MAVLLKSDVTAEMIKEKDLDILPHLTDITVGGSMHSAEGG